MKEGHELEAEVRARGITRICHFTPSRNLAQIIAGTTGVLATSKLQEDERQVFAPTDLQRLDGFKEHICCSIEYPNAWYFERARGKESLFKDWVVLLIRPKYLWLPRTKFCPRNAAAGFGREVADGIAGFRRLFSESSVGAYGRTYMRSSLRPPSCPTDEQAEILVPDAIDLSDIIGIAVRDEDQARNELIRLGLLGISQETMEMVNFQVVPAFWEKNALSKMLGLGKRPIETPFNPMRGK